MSGAPDVRLGSQPGETVCPGCIYGSACRVIPCSGCKKPWHLLGMIDNPFVCPRCEDTRVASPVDAPTERAHQPECPVTPCRCLFLSAWHPRVYPAASTQGDAR